MGTKKGAEQEKGGQDEAAQILVESHVGCQSFQLTGPSPQFLPEMVFTNGLSNKQIGKNNSNIDWHLYRQSLLQKLLKHKLKTATKANTLIAHDVTLQIAVFTVVMWDYPYVMLLYWRHFFLTKLRYYCVFDLVLRKEYGKMEQLANPRRAKQDESEENLLMDAQLISLPLPSFNFLTYIQIYHICIYFMSGSETNI